MSLSGDDELTIKICKFGGPLVLFICAPIYVYILISVYKRDFAAGGSTAIGVADIANFSIFILMSVFGIWMCRRGYGCFGGNKPPKSQL
jgi:hypothetical protein